MLSVLIAEDDRMLSSVLECYLHSFGISVIRTASVPEAQRALSTMPVDCVISDYFLEGGTAKDIATSSNVPMIIVSGFDRSFDPDLHKYTWMTKPVDLGNLERMVRRLCAQPA